MLFGVPNVNEVFMEYMSIIFQLYLDQFVVVFIDGILIYLKIDEEHVEHLRVVLQTLEKKRSYMRSCRKVISGCEV